MKKEILIILFVFAGISLYAQDTTFVLQSEVAKSSVRKIMPDSICNMQEASREENAHAWYYHQIVPIPRLNMGSLQAMEPERLLLQQ